MDELYCLIRTENIFDQNGDILVEMSHDHMSARVTWNMDDIIPQQTHFLVEVCFCFFQNTCVTVVSVYVCQMSMCDGLIDDAKEMETNNIHKNDVSGRVVCDIHTKSVELSLPYASRVNIGNEYNHLVFSVSPILNHYFVGSCLSIKKGEKLKFSFVYSVCVLIHLTHSVLCVKICLLHRFR